MTVRVRKPDDEQLLAAVRLGEAMWAESPVYGHLERDTDKMIEYAYHARADENTFFMVACNSDDAVTGFLVGGLGNYGFYDGRFAYDHLLYVEPNERGGAVASVLISVFEDWATKKGAISLRLGVTTGIHTEGTERLYNRLGYKTVGLLTAKELR